MNVRKQFKIFSYALLFAVAVSAALWAGLSIAANHRYKTADAKWKQVTGRSLTEYLKARPETAKNDTAAAIEKTAERMGIKSEVPGDEWVEAKKALSEYLPTELAKEKPAVATPPEALSAFLKKHSDQIKNLRSSLGHNPEPVWEWNPQRVLTGQTPELLPLMYLQKILAADALSAVSESNANRALADAETGRRLNEAIYQRPELISKLIAMAAERLWAGVLRKIPDPQQEWMKRLQETRPVYRIVDSFEAEACGAWQMAGNPFPVDEAGGKGSFFHRTGVFLYKPFLRLCGSNYINAMADLSLAMKNETACTGDPSGPTNEIRARIPKWDFFTRTALPSLDKIWPRAWRLKLDCEFTAKVLEVNMARAANGGAWPDTIPGIEKCKSCKDGSFKYSVDGDSMTLTYEGNVPAEGEVCAYLPLRYEVGKKLPEHRLPG